MRNGGRSSTIRPRSGRLRSFFSWHGLPVLLLVVVLGACGSTDPEGPPDVRYGESVCAECGMILSDERYATATLLEGDRGPEYRLFDDFNCQIDFEADGASSPVLERWVHDHETRAWVRAASATYVRSPELRTPMASEVAAFTTREDAVRAADELDGEVLSFHDLWED